MGIFSDSNFYVFLPINKQMLETLLILGNFKHPFLCSVAFIFRVHKKMTESYLVRKKTTPDLSIVKRLGGSRAANVRTILQLYAMWKHLNGIS